MRAANTKSGSQGLQLGEASLGSWERRNRDPVLYAIAAALSKEYPQRKTFTVLEDNDPTGFRSKAGLAAKESAGIKTFEIPKRSPSLNVCDYALWTEVNKRMRAQEKRMPSNKRESRAEFLKRLKRTALRLPSSFVDSSIKQMRKRCQRLQDAKGGHFEEGH